MTYNYMKLLAIIIIASALQMPVIPANAQDQKTAPPSDAPPVPTGLDDSEEMVPEVSIIQRGRDRVEEYRINGQLYMVRIIPPWGYPYYLIDLDRDGTLETRHRGLEPPHMVPQWILYRW